ncbi:hypothetical protein M0805_006811 [Coniferiporia weirii]|nr:hypothetical protein M0805_006811 [Coniferiporia weirii]
MPGVHCQFVWTLFLPTTSVTHVEVASPAAWCKALVASGSAPEMFKQTKTPVFKPKIPIDQLDCSRQETQHERAALASADLLTEFFALEKDSLSPLALNMQTFLKVVTVLDASLVSSLATFAVCALASDSTVLLSQHTCELTPPSIQVPTCPIYMLTWDGGGGIHPTSKMGIWQYILW